ncbi:MAG: hypothetical protein GY838_09325 [bacterium]|nr:hypothetical protein [bacterium]
MNTSEDFAAPFRLDRWLVQPELNRVQGPDGEVGLEPRVMLVLVRLARKPGRVVTRDELLDEVWGDTIVGEENLTRAISDLRRVLGDNARRPTYIETVRNHGYRLVAPVAPAEAQALSPTPPPAAPPETSEPPVAPEPAPSLSRGRHLPWGTIIAVLVIVVLLVGQRFLPRDDPAPAGLPTQTSFAPARSVPLTSYAGYERHPALSTDGTRVAFVWTGHDDGPPSVWIKQRDSETPLRLSDAPGWAAWPVWRPDGQAVAWVQADWDSSEIRVVPALGGADRTLFSVRGPIAGLDWSPDGKQLVFSSRDTTTGGHRIQLLDLATLAVTPLAADRPTGVSDVQPRFAPDGRRLTWIGLEGAGGSSLWVGETATAATRQLLTGPANLEGAAWTAAGDGLIFAAAPAGMYQLWLLDLAGGGSRRLTGAGDFAWNPSVARGTGDLVYEQVRVDRDLWRVRILEKEPWRLETAPFLASTRWDYEADYSPDGRSIAFVSARSGAPELWVCDRDGTDPRRLTTFGGDAVTHPRWSPDGRRVACNILGGGGSRVVLVAVRGGPAVELTAPADAELLSGWHPDGESVLVTGEVDGVRSLLRRPTESGERAELLRRGVIAASADATGRLFFVAGARAGVWQVPLDSPSAEAELVIPGLAPFEGRNWRLVEQEIYWVMHGAGGSFLMLHDLAAGRSSILTDLPGREGDGLAVAPDAHAVIYPRSGPAEGDLMLIGREYLIPGPSSLAE